MSGNGGYSEQALYDEASSNPQTQLQGVLAGGQATNVAGTNLTVAELMGQLGLVNPGLNEQNQYAQLQGSYAEANAGLGQEQLGLQAQGLGAQAGLLNTQYGIQQQTLAGQEKLSGQQYALSQADLAAQGAQQKISSRQPAGHRNPEPVGSLWSPGTALDRSRLKPPTPPRTPWPSSSLPAREQGRKRPTSISSSSTGSKPRVKRLSSSTSLGSIARGEQGLGLSAQANGLGLDQQLNQINYGMQQAGLGAQQNADQPLRADRPGHPGQGSSYQAGAIGYGALLGGVNLNQALSGGG